jgi:hypothetical protein
MRKHPSKTRRSPSWSNGYRAQHHFSLARLRERVGVRVRAIPSRGSSPSWPKEKLKVYRIAFEKEKELTDRALKLAEIGKSKSNWELQGILGLAAFAYRIVGRGKGSCCYAANCGYFELRYIYLESKGRLPTVK